MTQSGVWASHAYAVDVANYGTNPILNVQAKVSIFGVTVASNAFLTIGAGSTETVQTTTRPEEPMLPDRSVNEIRADVNLEVTFTDVNGLQWRRQGTDQPERILESAGEAPAAS